LFAMSVFVHFPHTYRDIKLVISLPNFIKMIKKIKESLEEQVARQEQIGRGKLIHKFSCEI
jgi:hypothetical protein